jgi:hypothetical protein
MKSNSLRQKINYISMVENLSDRYLMREILFFVVILLSYVSFTSYTPTQINSSLATLPYISPRDAVSIVSIPFFICIAFYSASVASSLSSSLRSGSIPFLFTMPVSRSKFYFLFFFITVILSSALFIAAFLILMHLLSFTYSGKTILMFLVIMESSIFFYTGIGMLLASLLRSGAATFMVMFGGIFGLMVYSYRILPNVSWVQLMIKGVSYLPSTHSDFTEIIILFFAFVTLSFIMTFFSYFVLRFKNLRSGKGA